MPEQSFRKSRDVRPTPPLRNRILKKALWAAFPDAASENDLSKRAAEALDEIAAARARATGEDPDAVPDRAIRKWFAGQSFPQGRTLRDLGLLVGAELIMDLMIGKWTR